MPITFHKEEVEFDLPNSEKMTIWLNLIAEQQGKTIDKIAYIFLQVESHV